MAQHSNPFNWLKSLAATPHISRDRACNPRELDPVPKHGRCSLSLPGLLLSMGSLVSMGGLALSCVALPARAETARVYIVEVLSNSEDVLEVVRTAVSDAYIVTKDDGTQSIIAGTFVDEANARRQATDLHALNVSPTSISPFEYTPEDEATLAEASGDVNNSGAVAANSPSQPDEPATTEFVAASDPVVSDSASASPTPEAAISEVVAQPQAPQSVAAAPPTSQPATPGGGSSDVPVDSDRQYSTLVPVPNGLDPAATLIEVQHFFPEASLQAYNQGQAVQTGRFSHRSQAQLQANWLQTKGLQAVAVPAEPLGPSNTTASAPPPEGAVNAAAPSSASTGTEASNPAVATPPTDALASAAPPTTNAPVSAAPVDAAAATPASSGTSPIAAAPVSSAAYWVLIADPVGEQLSDIQAIVPTAEAATYNQQQVVRTGQFATEEEALNQVRYLSTQGYEAGIFTADDPAIH